jgi:importin-4
MLGNMTRILAAIVNRQHPCQMDLGDADDQDEVEESSEYDWLVVDTALDAIIALSVALGLQFGEIWKLYEKPVMKFASSQEHYERSTAVGVIAECILGMGSAVTPYTEKLLTILLHRLSDEDPEAKSNAAYAVGLLVTYSTNTAVYLPMYNEILTKLEPLLSTQRARTLDNAAGCVSRMIMAHPEKVPIGEVLPILVDLLPLKEDYDENKPIYDCIVGLCKNYHSMYSIIQR